MAVSRSKTGYMESLITDIKNRLQNADRNVRRATMDKLEEIIKYTDFDDPYYEQLRTIYFNNKETR